MDQEKNKPEEHDPEKDSEKAEGPEEEETKLESCTFDPPLYRQRYHRVAEVLRQHDVKSVVDFGAAECNLIHYLKNIDTVEHIIGVDIDQSKLESQSFKIRPLTTDYLQPRDRPLLVQLYCGSVVQYDNRLSEVQGITMVEVIEHLESDVLEQLPKSLFRDYRPEIVVLTTPNSEYNVLFPNFSGFRHWDHKFEWTRQEFKDWCEPVASQYGYTVTYDGIGSGGEGTQHLGDCSQMAVFKKNLDADSKFPSSDDARPYVLISECHHPSMEDSGYTEEERILHEAEYYINMLRNDHKITMDNVENYDMGDDAQDIEDSTQLQIELTSLIAFQKMKALCNDVGKLGELLEGKGFLLSEDKSKVVVSLDDDDDQYSSYHDADYFDDNNPQDDDFYTTDTDYHTSTSVVETTADVEEESWDNDLETVPVPKLEIWNRVEKIEEESYVYELRQFRKKMSFDSAEPKVGRNDMKQGRWIHDEWEELCSKDGFGQFADVVDVSWSPMDQSDFENSFKIGDNCYTGEVISDDVINNDNFRLQSTLDNKPIDKTKDILSTDFRNHDEKPFSGNLSKTQEIISDNEQSQVLSDTELSTNCDTVSDITDNSNKVHNSPTSGLNGLNTFVTDYQNQPYLTLKDEIICRGCGCKMRRLKNGENLCGLSKTCQSNFIEKFSQKFSNVVNVNEHETYLELDSDEQFLDAD